MEFGCRYIYVDESRGQNEVYLESHLSPVTVPESQNVVALNPAFYDNVPHAEEPRSDEVKGLQHYRLSPECNVQQDLQTTSVQLEGQKIPPPVPPRRRKPSAPAPPGPKKPHCRLSPEYNVYEDLPPTYLVQLDDNKTPPPLPFRKNMSIDSGKPAHHATNEGPTEQPTIIIGSTVQKCRPPVPDRKMKPSLHKPAGLLQDEQYYVALPPVDHTDLDPTIQHGMKNPPIHQMSGLLPGVAIGPNPHNYLEVLPTLPTEMKMQAAPVKPPDRQMTSLPDPPIERLPANCNILLLNIGKMVENSDTHVQEPPLLCISCSAACSKLNHIQDTKTWTCVFCAAENPLSDDNRFESREEGDELYAGDRQFENEYLFADQAMIIFCIDISGSMSVTTEVTQDQSNDYNIAYKTRMEAVKSALDETLEFLHKQHSEKRVALVTFSDQVKLYGDGTTQPLVLQGAELLDPDHLKLQGIDQPMPHPVTETLHALKGRIQCLEEKGATALGPAALVSIAMASKNPGSKVIICTDGKANTELGNLEDISEEYSYQSSKLYYSNLGDLALQHSVAVSVVTIEGTYCRLPELGQLADKTGGKVNIVHPFKLANEFQSIIGEEIIATNVKLKVFLPQTMYFLYEGNNESVLERTFGSTTADTVLSTEFSIHSSKINEVLRYSQLPIQVHLSYTLPDGRSRLRILSQTRPVTNDCTAALECIDLSVLQIHSVQFSARLAMEGRVNEARNVALELKELIDLVMTHENKAYGVVYEDWEDSMSPIYEDLQVYMKKKPEQTVDSHIEEPVVKSFSDEMAKMIFHMKRAKNKVLNKLRSQTE